jgi:hypothetical protein
MSDQISESVFIRDFQNLNAVALECAPFQLPLCEHSCKHARMKLPQALAYKVAMLSAAAVSVWSAHAANPNLVPGFAFELRMSKEDYLKEVAALDQERIDPAKVDASPVPPFSVFTARITPGSQAERAGLTTNWHAISLNGHELWHHLQPWEPDEEGRREVTFVSPKGERKKLSFEPGTIGVGSLNYWRPEIAVLRLIPRGVWDRDMMVAAVSWSAGDHELSETALRAAMNRGMPPATVLYHYASLIALDRGEPKLAKELNTRVMNAFPAGNENGKDQEIPRFYRQGLREIGLALGDYRLFARANRENDGLRLPALPTKLAEQWVQWSITEDHGSLLPEVLKRQGPDLLAKCEKYVPRWQAQTDYFNFDPMRDGNYVEEVAPGHFNRQSFAPPGAVRDMAWHLRFAFRETGRKERTATIADNFLYFALMDRQMKSGPARSPLSAYLDRSALYLQIMRIPEDNRQEVDVAIGPCRSCVEMSPNLPSMSAEEFALFKTKVQANDPAASEVKRRVHRLSMIRSGNVAEIILNGRTLLRAPVDPQVEDLYPTFHAQGMSFAIEGMTVHEIGNN